MIRTYQYGDTTKITEHFKASEFQCKCGKPHEFQVSDELVQHLENLREILDCRNIHVSSGFRCYDHDIAVGGKGNGKHTMGLAADVICYGKDGKPISSKLVSCTAQDLGFKGIANITMAYTSTHLDMREGKKWYGDETKGTNWGCDDLYTYYGIPREDLVPPSLNQPKEIKKGCRGEEVKKLQTMLVEKGYLRKNEIDGSFGKITLGAVLAYQFENGLEVNGIWLI